MLKNLALGFENSLPAAQKFNMGVANIGDHGNVGPYHAPQIRDLPEVVHTGLNHSGLMLRLQPQQRQRRADIVIEVCRGVFSTWSFAPSAAATISFVVVLPTLPVIWIKGISKRSR